MSDWSVVAERDEAQPSSDQWQVVGEKDAGAQEAKANQEFSRATSLPAQSTPAPSFGKDIISPMAKQPTQPVAAVPVPSHPTAPYGDQAFAHVATIPGPDGTPHIVAKDDSPQAKSILDTYATGLEAIQGGVEGPQPKTTPEDEERLSRQTDADLASAQKYLVTPFEKAAKFGSDIGRDVGTAAVAQATGKLPTPIAGEGGFVLPVPGNEMPSGEEFKKALAKTREEHPIASGVAAGVGSAVGGMATDPRNYPFFFGSLGGEIARRVISAGFSAQMAKAAIENSKELGAIMDDASVPKDKKVELGTAAILSTLMAADAGAHAVNPAHKPVLQPDILPPKRKAAGALPSHQAPTIEAEPAGKVEQSGKALPQEAGGRPAVQASDNPEELRKSAAEQEPTLEKMAEAAVAPVPGGQFEGSRVKEPESQDLKEERGKPGETNIDHLGARVSAPDDAGRAQVEQSVEQQLPVVSKEKIDANGLDVTQYGVKTGKPGDANQVSELQVTDKANIKAMEATEDLYEKQKQALASGDKAEADRIGQQIAAKHEEITSGSAPSSEGGKWEVVQEHDKEPKYQHGSTQADIPKDSQAAKVLDALRAQIPEEHLAGKGKDIDAAHVTVRYGLDGDEDKVKAFLEQQAPFEARLGKTGKFEPSESSDGAAVIQAPIEAPELHRINAEIAKHGQFAESNFPEYKPHATIAYVKPEVADKYVGMNATAGKTFTVDQVAITDRQGNKQVVKLKGASGQATREGQPSSRTQATSQVAPVAPSPQTSSTGERAPVASRATSSIPSAQVGVGESRQSLASPQRESSTKSNRDRFAESYQKHLADEVTKNPSVYGYSASKVPDVASRMVEALAKGSGNKNSPAVRATLKELGIKDTYSAIKEFLNEKPKTQVQPVAAEPARPQAQAQPAQVHKPAAEGESETEAARRGGPGEPPKEELPVNQVPVDQRASTLIPKEEAEKFAKRTEGRAESKGALEQPSGAAPRSAQRFDFSNRSTDSLRDEAYQKRVEVKSNERVSRPTDKGTTDRLDAIEREIAQREKPLHVFKDEEDGVEARVFAGDRGTFNVAVHDTDSGETLGTIIKYSTEEAAVAKAKEIALRPKEEREAARKPASEPLTLTPPPDDIAVRQWIDTLSRSERGYAKAAWRYLQEHGKEDLEANVFPNEHGITDQQAEAIDQHLVGIADDRRPVGKSVEAGEGPVINRLVDAVYDKLSRGESLGNVTELNRMAEQILGASRTSGEWSPRDVFDAMEAGVNKYLLEHGKELMAMPVEEGLKELKSLESRLTSQGTRTEEQLTHQQFSTPPRESYLAARVGLIKPTDVVLEPSAGNGGLAVWPKSIGAEVHVNEIAPRRQQMLEAAGFGKPSAHDGEIINAKLDPAIKPTVVLMNPPFSSKASAGGVGANDAKYGFNHVNQALQRLEPNGRLVAILGGGRDGFPREGANLLPGTASREWFEQLAKRYNVRANVRVSGKEYQKYGTSYATRIIVIDKTGPTASLDDIVQGDFKTLEEAYNALRNVAESRPANAASIQERPTAAVRSEVPLAADRGPRDLGAGTGSRTQPAVSGQAQPAGPTGRPVATPRPGGPARTGSGDEPGAGAQPLPLREPGLQPEERAAGEAAPSARGSDENAAERPLGGDSRGLTPTAPEKLDLTQEGERDDREQEDSGAYVAYKPTIQGGAHPGDIVETKTMSTVPLPKITYKPSLPASFIKESKLSAVQLEAVAIAGQQNQIILPSGHRASALIGDGTGVGKGRIGAGVLYDNWNQGRKRLVWVSEKWDLMQDAIRDLKGIGALELAGKIKPFQKFDVTKAIDHQGIVFSTYALIRSADKKGNTRISQLERWLKGEDNAEGAYIIYDESHNLKNAVAGGRTPPSQIGKAVKEFMQRVPNLRSASLSATAASDVMNLGYLDRLGLWGPGTPFPNGFEQFAAEIGQGGISAMEMIARELKAQGKYLARTLSYRGVTYDMPEHKLTVDQKEVYRTAAKAWRSVQQIAEETIKTTLNGSGQARGNFLSQFYGAQQRFFNLLITTLKIPTAVEMANKALGEDKSVLITLVNTNEAAQNREKAKVATEDRGDDEPPDYDFGPKNLLMDLVKNHFPTQQWEDAIDDQGRPYKRPVVDANGKPVTNPEAERERDALVAKLDKELHMPDNPLDILINSLGGPSKVAELTGRKERVDSSTGKLVARGGEDIPRDKVNLAEMASFQAGKKRVAVLSNAAGTGISMHAGNDVANKQKRVHITLQAGWSADKAMQMLGRSHRTNQVQPPHYDMLVSDLGGEKRFIASIARRLGSLGALSRGQKNATSGTDAMDKFNFESNEGRAAARAFYEGMMRRGSVVPGTNLAGIDVLREMGVLKVDKNQGEIIPDADKTNITRLLNRILSLDPDVQNAVYDYYYDVFQAVVQQAIDDGSLDTGVRSLPGDDFNVKEERPISSDPQTGAKTFYYPVEAKVRTHRVAVADAEKKLRQKKSENARLMRNDKGKLALMYDARPIVHADGSSSPASYVVNPGNGIPQKIENAYLYRYKDVPNKDVAMADWQEQYDESPSHTTAEHHLIGGAVMRWWNPIRDAVGERLHVFTTLDSKTGKRVVGVEVPPAAIRNLLDRITGGASTVNAAQLIPDVVKNNLTYTLEGNIQVRRGRVARDSVVQFMPPNENVASDLKRMGVLYEKGIQPIYYLPTGDRGESIAERVLKQYPVKGGDNAVREPGASGVLPRQPEEVGSAGSERGGVGPREQRQAPAETQVSGAENGGRAPQQDTRPIDPVPVRIDNHNTGSELEKKLEARLQANGAQMVRDYFAKHTGQDGAINVSTDAAKRMFPENASDPVGTDDDVRGAAFALHKAVWETALNRPVIPGRDGVVILTGTPGSGKTATAESQADVDIKREMLLTDRGEAEKAIHQIIDAGRKPIITGIFLDDPKENVRRMIRRAVGTPEMKGIGRTVKIDYMGRAYVEIPRVLKALKDKFGEQIDVRAIDNSGKPGEAKLYNGIDEMVQNASNWTKESAREAMHEELDRLREEGQVPDATYRAAKQPESQGDSGQGKPGPGGRSEPASGQQERGVLSPEHEVILSANPIFDPRNWKNFNKAYDDAIQKFIDRGLKIGDKYFNVKDYDPQLADNLHLLDNAPRYMRDKAQANLDTVFKGLSQEQIRLASLMVDSDSRDYLRDKKPDEYDRAINDKEVMAAVNKFTPLQQELTDDRLALGWPVRRSMQAEQDPNTGEWNVSDRDGNVIATAKTQAEALKYVEKNATFEPHLKRTYPEHMRQPLPFETGQGPRTSSYYNQPGIRPPKMDKKARLASAEYHYEHGAKDFSGYIESYRQTKEAMLKQSIYDDFTQEATKWVNGTAQPPEIDYNGETYYRPDVARKMREGGKKVEEYSIYDPTRGERFLVKNFEEGWAVLSTGKPGISAQERWLAPKVAVDALEKYDASRGGQATSIRRFFQEQIVGLFGPMVHINNIVRRLGHVTGAGAFDPRSWPSIMRLLASSTLRDRLQRGVNDDTIDLLTRRGAYTDWHDVGNLHAYWGGNLNPFNWVRSFGKGVLFDPKFAGGWGGLDPKARVLVADYLKDHVPGIDDQKIADVVNDAMGNYNRANWTERQRKLAYFTIFPGWDTASAKWFLRHPILTALAPALVTLLANLAMNQLGKNKDEDKYDFGYLHYGDRKYRTGLVTESMAQHLAAPVLNAAKSALEGGDAREVAGAAGQGFVDAGAGLASYLRPDAAGAVELIANRETLGRSKEIFSPGDEYLPGKVLPNRKLDKLAVHATLRAFPAARRFLAPDQTMDLETGVGSIAGISNYRYGAEERLKANEAKAHGYSETIDKIAAADPDAATAMVQDPDKAAYLVFHGDLATMVKDLHEIDSEIQRVKDTTQLSSKEKDDALKSLGDGRTNLLKSADALSDALFQMKEKKHEEEDKGSARSLLNRLRGLGDSRPTANP